MSTGQEKKSRTPFTREKGGKLFYPWELTFERILTPFEEFIERETTSGIVLIVGTLLALTIANSPLRHSYESLIHLPISLSVGPLVLERSLLHWVNEGFMVFFFFIVGLEIKREILVGELAELRQAVLPVVAAAGGMIAPAVIYHLINPSGDYAHGWGIPMATDIAFCVSALVLLGRRVPQALTIFLVALAIVDDLGAVAVIALFYTKTIHVPALAGAAGFLCSLLMFNLAGFRRNVPFALAGLGLWLCLLFSGVHAAIAGALIAFCVPARGRYKPAVFSNEIKTLLNRFEKTTRGRECILSNMEQFSVLQKIDHEVHLAKPPLQRMLSSLHLPVALLVIPSFALVNAGITLDMESLSMAVLHPVSLGVMAGLIIGKACGITAFSWVFSRMGIVSLPEGVRIGHIAGVGILGGIGFTMSIFIAELSFGALPDTREIAKTGVILGSLLSGLTGMTWLWYMSRRHPPNQAPVHDPLERDGECRGSSTS
ncbi:MAG: Na+/H+ antiporter NhaA [Desulfomonilia bacterium]